VVVFSDGVGEVEVEEVGSNCSLLGAGAKDDEGAESTWGLKGRVGLGVSIVAVVVVTGRDLADALSMVNCAVLDA